MSNILWLGFVFYIIFIQFTPSLAQGKQAAARRSLIARFESQRGSRANLMIHRQEKIGK